MNHLYSSTLQIWRAVIHTNPRRNKDRKANQNNDKIQKNGKRNNQETVLIDIKHSTRNNRQDNG